MTANEETAIKKLNEIQLKITGAMNRILDGHTPMAMTPLVFARNDLDRIVLFLYGKAPTKSDKED